MYEHSIPEHSSRPGARRTPRKLLRLHVARAHDRWTCPERGLDRLRFEGAVALIGRGLIREAGSTDPYAVALDRIGGVSTVVLEAQVVLQGFDHRHRGPGCPPPSDFPHPAWRALMAPHPNRLAPIQRSHTSQHRSIPMTSWPRARRIRVVRATRAGPAECDAGSGDPDWLGRRNPQLLLAGRAAGTPSITGSWAWGRIRVGHATWSPRLLASCDPWPPQRTARKESVA